MWQTANKFAFAVGLCVLWLRLGYSASAKPQINLLLPSACAYLYTPKTTVEKRTNHAEYPPGRTIAAPHPRRIHRSASSGRSRRCVPPVFRDGQRALIHPVGTSGSGQDHLGTNHRQQVGNAVPISLGRAVGNLILSMMHDLPIKEYKEFKYSRYLGTTDRHMLPLGSHSAQLSLFGGTV